MSPVRRREAPDLARRDINVVRTRQIIGFRRAQEAEAVLQDFEHAVAVDGRVVLGQAASGWRTSCPACAGSKRSRSATPRHRREVQPVFGLQLLEIYGRSKLKGMGNAGGTIGAQGRWSIRTGGGSDSLVEVGSNPWGFRSFIQSRQTSQAKLRPSQGRSPFIAIGPGFHRRKSSAFSMLKRRSGGTARCEKIAPDPKRFPRHARTRSRPVGRCGRRVPNRDRSRRSANAVPGRPGPG